MPSFWLDYAKDTTHTHITYTVVKLERIDTSDDDDGDDAVNFYWRALKQICLGHFSCCLIFVSLAAVYG